ncbi:BRCA1-associated RING domain protein 1 isoform X4 [Hydra vulgaris]|uniref:BRCA1-associated RING domain protein 1 isoform X4 n=1 Tax=Hydra vulgaris TaxID=6087 RepID=A0ABM4CWH8_HYDVU
MDVSHDVDWSLTKEYLNVLMNLLTCSYCHNKLKEPCNFKMCDHYFCKNCAIILNNENAECPECKIALWKENLQLNLKIPDVLAICDKINSLIAKDKNVQVENENENEFLLEDKKILSNCIKTNNQENDSQNLEVTSAHNAFKNDETKAKKKRSSRNNCKTKTSRRNATSVTKNIGDDRRKENDLLLEINIPLAFSNNKNQNSSIEKNCSDNEENVQKIEDHNKDISYQNEKSHIKSDRTDLLWHISKKPKLTYNKRVSLSKNNTSSTTKPFYTDNNEEYSIFDFKDDVSSTPVNLNSKRLSDTKKKDTTKLQKPQEMSSNKLQNQSALNQNSKNNQKQKPLATANKSLTKRNNKGETSLHTACIKGNLQKARDLLQLGADPNTKDNAGWTPLHEACNHGTVDIVKLLLSYGAILDMVAGEDHDTPLHDAVANNQVDVVKLLLKHAAPTNKRNRLGKLPIDYATTEEMKELFKENSLVVDKSYVEGNSFLVNDLVSPKVFVTTNLSEKENSNVSICCQQLGAKLQKDFNISVTHVICGADKSLLSVSRTMKYLLGLITGKWLVSYQWVLDSLAKKNWQNENDYEMKGTPGASNNIPMKSRINRLKYLPGLFEGCSFYFSGAYSVLSKDKLSELVKYGGGKILLREPKANDLTSIIPSSSRRKIDILPKNLSPVMIFHAKENSSQACCTEYIIYDPKMSPQHKKTYSPLLCSAPVSWLLDCVSCFEILDVRDDDQKN